MKAAATIVSFLMLFLVYGANYAHAQSAEPAEVVVAQDSRMDDDGPRMMQGEHRSIGMRDDHMGMSRDMMETRHHIMEWIMELGLDQKQVESIHEIVDSTTKEMIKKRADLLIAWIDLEDILHREPLDLNAAESQMKKIEAMKTDMFMTHLKSMEEIKSQLTPEQRSKLKEMFQMHRMGKGMEGKKPYHEEKKMMK